MLLHNYACIELNYFAFKFILWHFLWNVNGVFSRKAARAEAAVCSLGNAFYAVKAEISYRICSYFTAYFRNGQAAGNKVLLTVDIGSEVAGVGERRAGDSEMNLLCARFAEQINDPCRGRASYDAVVDQNDSFSADDLPDNVQLDFDSVSTLSLAWLNKGSSNVAVFYKAYAVGDPRSVGESESRVETAVGDSYNDVGVNGVLLPQKLACAEACFVNAASLDNRIGTRSPYKKSSS